MNARETFDAWTPKSDGSIGGLSYWSVWKAAWDAAKEEAAKICYDQAKKGGGIEAWSAAACGDKIRAL